MTAYISTNHLQGCTQLANLSQKLKESEEKKARPSSFITFLKEHKCHLPLGVKGISVLNLKQVRVQEVISPSVKIPLKALVKTERGDYVRTEWLRNFLLKGGKIS